MEICRQTEGKVRARETEERTLEVVVLWREILEYFPRYFRPDLSKPQTSFLAALNTPGSDLVRRARLPQQLCSDTRHQPPHPSSALGRPHVSILCEFRSPVESLFPSIFPGSVDNIVLGIPQLANRGISLISVIACYGRTSLSLV
jgi:hypothetical protein